MQGVGKYQTKLEGRVQFDVGYDASFNFAPLVSPLTINAPKKKKN